MNIMWFSIACTCLAMGNITLFSVFFVFALIFNDEKREQK